MTLSSAPNNGLPTSPKTSILLHRKDVDMPSRWDLRFSGVPATAAPVRPEHIHAVISRWFDWQPGAHSARAKPYATSRPTTVDGGVTVQLSLVDDQLVDHLLQQAGPGTQVKLGDHEYTVAALPQPLSAATWTALATVD